MHRLWIAALTLLLLSLAACSGGQAPLGSPAGPDPGQTAPDMNTSAAGLPLPSEIRLSSGSVGKLIEASNYTMLSLGAEPLPDETDMRLSAMSSKREWAIYYSQVGNAQIGGLDIELKAGSIHTGNYWVGYADYAYDVWRWHGPFSYSASLPAPLLSDDQNVVFAVVTPRDTLFTFDRMELQLSGSGVEAILSADPPQGEAPLGVGFSAVNSQCFDAPVARYEWDFDGDGTYDLDSGTDPTVDHGYSEPGWFYARLRVTDANGESDIAEQLVKVTLAGTVPPVAALEIQPAYIETGAQVLLDGSGSSDIDGSIIFCSWDFDGDGSYDADTGASKFTNHVYQQAGDYNVRLLVVDDGGMSDEISVPITVQDP
ncbi:PKD domain-containing protein [bacterium]|nr:PKD domain-containing protein [bacterium]